MLISCKLLQSLTRPFNFTHSTIYSHSLSLNYTVIIYHGSISEPIIFHAFSFIHPSVKLIHNNSCTILNTHIHHYTISLLISCKLLQSLTRPFNFTHSTFYSHSLSLNYTVIIYHGSISESISYMHSPSFTHLVKLIHNNSCTILNTHIHHHNITQYHC